MAIERLQTWCVERKVIEAPILDKIEKPCGRQRDRIPTKAEIEAILAIATPEFWLIYQSLRHCGARPNELCRTTVADLRWDEDGERGTIVLEKHKTAKKTGKPRLIPVGKRLAELIRESLGDRTEGPLFLRPNGKPWTTQTLSSNFRRLRQKAGLPDDLCLYLTRHEHGTVITEKFGIKAAADALGHSNIQTTMRYAKRDLRGMKDRQDAFGESDDPPPAADAA